MLAHKRVEHLVEGDKIIGDTGTAYTVKELTFYGDPDGDEDVRPCIVELHTEPPLPAAAQFIRSDQSIYVRS